MKHLKAVTLIIFFSLTIIFVHFSDSIAYTTYSKNILKEVSAPKQPLFRDDSSLQSLSEAVSQSLEYLKKMPAQKKYDFGSSSFSKEWLQESLEYFLELLEKTSSPSELQQLLAENFHVYQAVDGIGGEEVLVTGYYEPILKGSLQKRGPFQHPLYAPPADLVHIKDDDGRIRTGRYQSGRLMPYWTRREIDETDVLHGNELVFLKDPVDAFILHIQGSGRIELTDGNVRQIQYAAKNGQPYRSIGKYLVDQGLMQKEEASMPGIREYLQSNKSSCSEILYQNPSYIFFQWGNESQNGPKGCLNRPLTPLRSVALDQKVFPPGALGFLQTWQPTIDNNGKIINWQPVSLFVLNQDSGSAIKGPARVDLFWGRGKYAETAAGHMKHPGRLFFLVKKMEAF